MNWGNIKNCLCPKCGEALELHFEKGYYSCTNPSGCSFRVGKDRFDEMQTDMETGHNSFNRKAKYSENSGWGRF